MDSQNLPNGNSRRRDPNAPSRLSSIRNSLQSFQFFFGTQPQAARAETVSSHYSNSAPPSTLGQKTPRLDLDIEASHWDLPFVLHHDNQQHTQPQTYRSPTIADLSPVTQIYPSFGGASNHTPVTPNNPYPHPLQARSGAQPEVLSIHRQSRLGLDQLISTPPAVRYAESNSNRYASSHARGLSGSDPEEQALLEIVSRRTRHKHRNRRRPRPHGELDPRFNDVRRSRDRMCCVPGMRNPRLKHKMWRSIVSGMALVVCIVIYIALALTTNTSTEIHILLILSNLAIFVFFAHSLITLCIASLKPKKPRRINIEKMRYGPGGVAVPDEPIPIVLATDEEAMIDSGGHGHGKQPLPAMQMPPPAYGLWRESVRVDPGLIYWQKLTESELSKNSKRSRSSKKSKKSKKSAASTAAGSVDGSAGDMDRHPSLRRPPSYSSDDGVDYVVEAQGRNVAPPAPEMFERTPPPQTRSADVYPSQRAEERLDGPMW